MAFIDILTLIFSVFLEYVFMVSITAIQTLVYSKSLGVPPQWRGKRLTILVFLIGFLEASIQLISLNITDFSGIRYIYLLIFFLYPILFMGGKRRERIFFSIVSLATLLFSILFSSTFFRTNNIVRVTNSSSWLYSTMLTGLIIAIYAILTFIIYHLTNEGKHYIPPKYWHSITICYFVLMLCLYIVYSAPIWFAKNDQLYTYLTIFSVSLFAIWLLMYFVFYFACRYYSKAFEVNLLALQNNMIEKYFLQKQAADEKIQLLRHDLKHSLFQLSQLANETGNTDALQFINEYEHQLTETNLIDVKNENANAILNQKSWEAKKSGVKFLVEGVFYDDLILSKLDLCNLIGNLLDNAIEAASHEGVCDNLRSVKFTSKRKGNLLMLVVENGYAIKPVLEGNRFKTTKKQSEHHGIGTRSIQYIADKYSGVIDMSFLNNWFIVTILLNGYQTGLSNKN